MLKTLKAAVATTVTALALTTCAVLTAAPSSARAVWDTSPVHVAHAVKGTPGIVDLRVGEHPTYDRVVIDMSGAVTGYDVRYVAGLHYDPSGEQVPLRGARFIQITLKPATAHDAQGNSIYRGQRLAQYTLPALRGTALIGDYEGVVSFGVSLSRLTTFRVFELHAPDRLVIDLHH